MEGWVIPIQMYYVLPHKVQGLMIDIVFMTEFTGVNDTVITDYDGLRKLGDEKMGDLILAVNATTSAARSGPGGNCISHINIFLIFLTILSTVVVYI